MSEFGEHRRIPVKFDKIPRYLIDAVVAVEDDQFWNHAGVDFYALLAAVYEVATTGRKTRGGSTITMQVARNFFLSPEQTYTRKFNEILLALKIESELDKEKIMELYLNKIFLGHRAYGISAASQVYYDKKLEDLSLAQSAMIAGLPKAPSKYNPISNPERALIRRNYILGRMRILKYISEDGFDLALSEPITADYIEPEPSPMRNTSRNWCARNCLSNMAKKSTKPGSGFTPASMVSFRRLPIGRYVEPYWTTIVDTVIAASSARSI